MLTLHSVFLGAFIVAQCTVRCVDSTPRHRGDCRTRVEAHRTAEADDAKKWRKYATMGPAEARKVLRSIQ